MIYRGNPESFLFLFLVVISFQFISYNIYFIVIPVLIVLLALIRFDLHIADHKLVYKATIFGITVYERKVDSGRITKLKFKRSGWAKKCAVVYLEKGLNIRLVEFQPTSVYDELLNFAEIHNIRVIRSKDYDLLTKMRRSSETK